ILTADRRSVRLNPALVTTDTAEFDALLQAAEQTDSPVERARLLEQAVRLYRGELLPGCYEEGAVTQQNRYHERYDDALQQWSEALEASGSLEAALRAAQQAVQSDPYREGPYRIQMRQYAKMGRTVAALETFKQLEQVLKTELGVAPSASTRKL